MRKSQEYKIWLGMLQRCSNKKNKSWPDYGGRGIVVVQRWQQFENFFQDVGRRPGPEWSLDRTDNDGPYGPDNVRWATKAEQANNRRICRLYTAFGREQTLTLWAREFGLHRLTLLARMRHASLEEALVVPTGFWRRAEQPKRKGRRFLTFQGETLSFVEWAEKLGLRPQNIWRRLHNGYSVAETLQPGHYRERWRQRGEKTALLPMPSKNGKT